MMADLNWADMTEGLPELPSRTASPVQPSPSSAAAVETPAADVSPASTVTESATTADIAAAPATEAETAAPAMLATIPEAAVPESTTPASAPAPAATPSPDAAAPSNATEAVAAAEEAPAAPAPEPAKKPAPAPAVNIWKVRAEQIAAKQAALPSSTSSSAAAAAAPAAEGAAAAARKPLSGRRQTASAPASPVAEAAPEPPMEDADGFTLVVGKAQKRAPRRAAAAAVVAPAVTLPSTPSAPRTPRAEKASPAAAPAAEAKPTEATSSSESPATDSATPSEEGAAAAGSPAAPATAAAETKPAEAKPADAAPKPILSKPITPGLSFSQIAARTLAKNNEAVASATTTTITTTTITNPNGSNKSTDAAPTASTAVKHDAAAATEMDGKAAAKAEGRSETAEKAGSETADATTPTRRATTPSNAGGSGSATPKRRSTPRGRNPVSPNTTPRRNDESMNADAGKTAGTPTKKPFTNGSIRHTSFRNPNWNSNANGNHMQKQFSTGAVATHGGADYAMARGGSVNGARHAHGQRYGHHHSAHHPAAAGKHAHTTPASEAVQQAALAHQRRVLANVQKHATGPWASETEPVVLDWFIKCQIEFYFSSENLCSDFYLRSQMNAEGWISLMTLIRFNRARLLFETLGQGLGLNQAAAAAANTDGAATDGEKAAADAAFTQVLQGDNASLPTWVTDFVQTALEDSPVVELSSCSDSGWRIRRAGIWSYWVPNAAAATTAAAAATQPHFSDGSHGSAPASSSALPSGTAPAIRNSTASSGEQPAAATPATPALHQPKARHADAAATLLTSVGEIPTPPRTVSPTTLTAAASLFCTTPTQMAAYPTSEEHVLVFPFGVGDVMAKTVPAAHDTAARARFARAGAPLRRTLDTLQPTDVASRLETFTVADADAGRLAWLVLGSGAPMFLEQGAAIRALSDADVCRLCGAHAFVGLRQLQAVSLGAVATANGPEDLAASGALRVLHALYRALVVSAAGAVDAARMPSHAPVRAEVEVARRALLAEIYPTFMTSATEYPFGRSMVAAMFQERLSAHYDLSLFNDYQTWVVGQIERGDPSQTAAGFGTFLDALLTKVRNPNALKNAVLPTIEVKLVSLKQNTEVEA
ncbi:hypothetical protein CXG81DRAFT_27689 [Caulochytrium protostelioides]|uniref:HTH La-type RNA-binding domain-containing protein n=1 Tax=Caulochytrium protostelioides TaxID=1555241 RepID=A0A4V1IU74_9FUNG|nr:hypothetical protein CXG81DRAFT_27689 [Caulochytrium protostelioides]|eukprot:RKO99568.1 hypothetical protein CXG81DRAFT_27689 [Caulochytrium protostelioides]